MKGRVYLYDVIMVLVGALTIGADQWSKAAIRQHFGSCGSGDYSPLIGQYFGLTYACNTGAAFSLFQHGHEALLFLFIGLALAVVIWLYLRFAHERSLLLKMSFGLILGGATGNLIDRFQLGYVTDFLLFSIKPVFTWPVFNLADSAICLGIFFLILYFWRRPGPTKQAQASPDKNSPVTEPASAEHPS